MTAPNTQEDAGAASDAASSEIELPTCMLAPMHGPVVRRAASSLGYQHAGLPSSSHLKPTTLMPACVLKHKCSRSRPSFGMCAQVASSLSQLLQEYKGWVEQQLKASDLASVAVLYASAYGNTSALAQVRQCA